MLSVNPTVEIIWQLASLAWRLARIPISSFCFYILQFDIYFQRIFYGQYMSEIDDWLRSNNTLYNNVNKHFAFINKFKVH